MKLKDNELLEWARRKFQQETEAEEAARREAEERQRQATEAKAAEAERVKTLREAFAAYGASEEQAKAEALWLASPQGQEWQRQRDRAISEYADEYSRGQLQSLAPAQSQGLARLWSLRCSPEGKALGRRYEQERRHRGRAMAALVQEEEAAVAAAIEAVRADYAERKARLSIEIQRENEAAERELEREGEAILRSWGMQPPPPIPAPPVPWWERIPPSLSRR